MKKLSILKIGGQLIEENDQLNKVLDIFAKLPLPKILVHGGGRRATQLSKSLNLRPQIIEGRRITDAATLEVVTMVYAGLINKNIVAQLQARNCQALGLTGADLNCLTAHKRKVKNVDYGFAGDIDQVNATQISTLLNQNISPVFCAITHDNKGQLLNTNADTISAQLAKYLSPFFDVHLYFCFEKKGVLANPENENSFLNTLNKERYREYRESHIIAGGMIPKLDNGFVAVDGGAAAVWICHPTGIKNKIGTQLTT